MIKFQNRTPIDIKLYFARKLHNIIILVPALMITFSSK